MLDLYGNHQATHTNANMATSLESIANPCARNSAAAAEKNKGKGVADNDDEDDDDESEYDPADERAKWKKTGAGALPHSDF